VATPETKIVRSYRLVFRRRWRIFRIQNWRIPLPGGLELRLIGYWLVCLAAISMLAHLPLLGLPIAAISPALRLLAIPLLAAWALCRWELDGRPPHRAAFGLLRWRLRRRVLAAGRRVPAPDTEISPLGALLLTPDLTAPTYPRGRVDGPARLLLRYRIDVRRPRRRQMDLCGRPGPALHKGHVLELPRGHVVVFEDGER
jgi:hypothetical protein